MKVMSLSGEANQLNVGRCDGLDFGMFTFTEVVWLSFIQSDWQITVPSGLEDWELVARNHIPLVQHIRRVRRYTLEEEL